MTVALALLSLAATGPVAPQKAERPQPPIGSHIPRALGAHDPDTYQYTRKESDQEFAAYSDCLVSSKSGERASAAFLRMVPGSPGWGAAGKKLTTPTCLRTGFGRVTMRFNIVGLRPALFAAMYRRRFGKTPPVGFTDAPALTLEAMYDGNVTAFPRAPLEQLRFGNCVARNDATAVHRLLVARPWSEAENAALPAVTDAMGKCLTQDQTLRLSRSDVRGVLAEAMYHLASGRAASAVVADAAATKGR